jgi:two-component system, LytTR family, response regulator
MSWNAPNCQMSALIADDEPLAREGLRLLLAEHLQSAVIAEAASGLEALTYIREAKPDIVFLDVQMPEMDGFDVAKGIDSEDMPAIVFVTAHDKYAIQAFEINAIDYLLKPVARHRFSQTMERVFSRTQVQGESARQILALLQAMAAPPRYIQRVSVRASGKTQFVNLCDIEWIQAAENYVQLHLRSVRHMLHVPINTLQRVLDPTMFMRIHRSCIVNTSQVKELETGTHGEFALVLHSGTRLQSSRTYHESIKRWAANPF